MSLDEIVKEEKYSKMNPKQKAAAIAREEKLVLKASKKAEQDEKVAAQLLVSQDTLAKTVSVVINVSEKYEWIKTKLAKYGEIEKFKGGSISVFEVKFATVEGAQAALAANFKVSIPVAVAAKKNKFHSVYFPVPEGASEEVDDDLFDVVREVFSEKGEVVNVYHKQKKYIVVEFDSKITRDAVVAAPRCEINGVTVYKVFPGIANLQKMARAAKSQRAQNHFNNQRGQNGSKKRKKNPKNAAVSSFDGQPPSLS